MLKFVGQDEKIICHKNKEGNSAHRMVLRSTNVDNRTSNGLYVYMFYQCSNLKCVDEIMCKVEWIRTT